MALVALAPAKINVTLSVLGRRPDGYHELDTLMAPLTFGDDVAVRPAAELTLERTGPCAADLPPVDEDLVWRAAVLLQAQLPPGKRPGAHISVVKRIPAAAGLGGGSADAAIALKLLNTLWDRPLTDAALMTLAAQIGSDVPFFFAGGPARVTGRGEIVARLPDLPTFSVVLVTPDVAKSTGEVFGLLHEHKPWPQPDVGAALHNWANADWLALRTTAGNSLATPMIARHRELQWLQEQMYEAGALLALMSGAGPTVFGLTANERAAQQIARQLAGSYRHVYVTQLLSRF